MAKILCVLYPDPVDGYPSGYARDGLPELARYPDGQTLPTPSATDFTPGALLGSVSGELGLRAFLEAGHELSSPRTRRARTPSSSATCRPRTSSSPSRSGPPTSLRSGSQRRRTSSSP